MRGRDYQTTSAVDLGLSDPCRLVADPCRLVRRVNECCKRAAPAAPFVDACRLVRQVNESCKRASRALAIKTASPAGRAGRGRHVRAGRGRADTRCNRTAFSLLEVILALAILAGAAVVLGEAARLGMRNAAAARDLSRAQLLCESKMAEVLAGLVPPDPVQRAPIEPLSEQDENGWVYSVAVERTRLEGMLAVRVTVMRDQPEEQRPAQFSIVRWMLDSAFIKTPET